MSVRQIRSGLMAKGIAAGLLSFGAFTLVPVTAEEQPPQPLPSVEETSAEEGAANTKERPFFGVVVREVDDAGFDGVTGLKVERVVSGQTAAEIGLEVGDVLQSFNGVDVATRAELSKALAGCSVGDEVTATWLRGNQALSGRALLQGKPNRKEISARLRESQEQIEELEAARAKQLEDMGQIAEEQASLGVAMLELSRVLESLPEQMQAAADEFKAVYPDGEFDVQVTISIKSHAGDNKTSMDLSPRRTHSDQDDATSEGFPESEDDQADQGEAESKDPGPLPPAAGVP